MTFAEITKRFEFDLNVGRFKPIPNNSGFLFKIIEKNEVWSERIAYNVSVDFSNRGIFPSASNRLKSLLNVLKELNYTSNFINSPIKARYIMIEPTSKKFIKFETIDDNKCNYINDYPDYMLELCKGE